MTTHHVRRTVRAAALAAVTAALALGLTACGGFDNTAAAAGGDHDSGGAHSRSASGTNARPANVPGGKDEVEAVASTTGVQPCRGDELLVTAVHRFAGQQGDHLLLTAVNQGTDPCWVTSYPAVVLDWNVDNVPLPHAKKDAPGGDTHMPLQPGDTVYSAVNLYNYGNASHSARALAFALRGTDGRVGPYYSVVVKGDQQEFSWDHADVLNWSTRKPYDF
ncbi:MULTISPECIES: DUF4232 domain-containing protein [Streptomyces]|jgi:hypothetical protein|uniref:DUF4232 domain-containing protein n=1 Tax=Streptomyces thermoviolaceus subsp. thermoviolaceus TaxID=66860 RepID=A0ABX0YX25_STRTL|nr:MULTISPECIES: DUF4232 domain-containing protein [Streptomyces]WTD46098.1 DUF4232 domain-containing protein [Streptomyces thermoviolaceus]NJP16653.1 DUF4232 domain-containing protein [Streptomyces thermoviolaceus subsp. thermoviolaceus]RSS06833.1 DUF4232 domain-containing protein [Streptomyces sp. WAC00469]GGV80835.1 hypothetical protein GCM10010499_44320 [Streptomyces thermoviolaceus subsp. apingens]GHA74449.1 hypothetical protein GCM10010512_00790 [Streptomyces thermoviolaceus subsp. therm